ncbi:hypothetical protein JZ751_023666 [Albula glossodonta]|uniref:Uncharacterized protein n=1 Tax=Albula glossodonta TaxID=121402 RepID=A0A8T2NHM9_9TELE|nr:hypothetical protein JZ751_023666 [Albula glossodonta]
MCNVRPVGAYPAQVMHRVSLTMSPLLEPKYQGDCRFTHFTLFKSVVMEDSDCIWHGATHAVLVASTAAIPEAGAAGGEEVIVPLEDELGARALLFGELANVDRRGGSCKSSRDIEERDL